MTTKQKDGKINWYRVPLSRDDLAAVNRRSDGKGLAQAVGHLGILLLTGTLAWVSSVRMPLPVTLLAFLLHGTCWAFLLNGFHELCHKTVFASKTLNTFFLYLFSFLGWNHPIMFWTSHQEHHKYTLHPPRDLEVVLPIRYTLESFLRSAIANPWDLIGRVKTYLRWSFGRLEGTWEHHLFPETAVVDRRKLFRWSRIHLIGHLLLAGISLYFGVWQVPVLITLAPFYGGWLLYLCNNTQHVGLMDNVSDFRLCCRTIYLNPVVRFLYWHMNYHTEHHMYAAVPCYNLSKLHELIKAEMPPCPRGIAAAWREILAILRKQKVDPTYQFAAPLPNG